MIILDTNIVSELMKAKPSIQVLTWLNQQEAASLFITAITIAEIAYGLNILPLGSRRSFLQEAFDKAIYEAFKQRVLVFNEAAAHEYGIVMGHRKNIGKPLNMLDGQIAAIARSNEAAIATRNIRDFQECDLLLMNPFET